LKITIVMGAFLPLPPIMGGAVEKAWFALGQEFARRGHTVVQISRAMPQLPNRETIMEVEHLRVAGYDTPASLVWLKTLDFFYSLRARHALPMSDVVVTNTFWLPFLLRTAKRGRLYVHVARFPKGQMRFYAHAARLQAPSSAVANAIIAEAPAVRSKTKVIPYPRPEAAVREVRSFAARARTILYVGRLHPEKGVHLLIRAFAALPAPLRGVWRLTIVGSAEVRLGGGGETYLTQLKRDATSVAERIEFCGPIFDEVELERVYREAELFVYPSLAERGETFGLAPLEAMSHGCAVLVSDLACFRDFVRNEETGFIFDHRGPAAEAALSSGLAQILAEEATLARVAEAGARVSEKYGLSRVVDQFLEDFAALQSGPIWN
jgi:glycosyltransferase involved in cell wall biosynthesis